MLTSKEIAQAQAFIKSAIEEWQCLGKTYIFHEDIFDDKIKALQAIQPLLQEMYDGALDAEQFEASSKNASFAMKQINDAKPEWGEEPRYLCKVNGEPVAELGGINFIKETLCQK